MLLVRTVVLAETLDLDDPNIRSVVVKHRLERLSEFKPLTDEQLRTHGLSAVRPPSLRLTRVPELDFTDVDYSLTWILICKVAGGTLAETRSFERTNTSG
jgi:hypothetical protein